VGLPVAFVPLVLVIMGVAYSLSAYPVGVLADRMDRVTLLVVGLLMLVAADLVLAFASGLGALVVGVALWGLHMGFTQGLLSTLLAEAAPAELRGTAFGMFNLVTGVALFLASALAGALWDSVGPQGTFLAGAPFAGAAMAGVVSIRPRLGNRAGSPS
jgi:MFS family permease